MPRKKNDSTRNDSVLCRMTSRWIVRPHGCSQMVALLFHSISVDRKNRRLKIRIYNAISGGRPIVDEWVDKFCRLPLQHLDMCTLDACGKTMCQDRFCDVAVVSHKSTYDYEKPGINEHHLVCSYREWAVL